jgi:hypothetical protein
MRGVYCGKLPDVIKAAGPFLIYSKAVLHLF